MPYGVSNSFKRGTMKTYSRQTNRVYLDDDPPRKKICMDERGMVQETTAPSPNTTTSTRPSTSLSPPLPSDPPSIFSSDPPAHEGSLSPPSSPPPCNSSPPKRAHKPIFSRLKRKRSATSSDKVTPTSPLTETTSTALNVPKTRPTKKVRLTQLQIDLGGEIRRSCKECGMDFIPSNAEDAALHKDFHSMNVKGVEMGKGFLKEVKTVGKAGEDELVVIVDGSAALGVRRKVRRVLEVVDKELGAVEVGDEVLWGRYGSDVNGKKEKGKKATLRASTVGNDEKEARFKVFLYLVGDRCVGLCLAERIRNASKVVGAPEIVNLGVEPGARSSAILAEEERHPALLGISRIWTSKSHRRKGIASALLDCVRGSFFYGIEVPREMVAFSQPSESGGRLAESWYGEKSGWLVYAEGCREDWDR